MKNKSLKTLCIILAAMLACSSAVAVYALTSEDTDTAEKTTSSAVNDAVENELSSVVNTDDADKEETVYVIANADGTVKKLIVSEWVKNRQSIDKLFDKSNLKDIVNVKGSETYSMDSDNACVWNASGKDIYYQGSSDAALPVDMAVTYQLNGKTIAPSELKGKSGKVTIRFDYTNKQSEKVVINGKSETIYVPFAMLTGMMLDNSKFTNITVSNGKIISDGDKSIVMGFALPGMQQNLGLDKSVLEIPDSVEITADVKDFSLATTMTVATNDIFNHIDLDNVDTLDKLKDKLNQLTDASQQLVDGSSKLYDGMSSLLDKSSELVQGVKDLTDAAKLISDGTDTAAAGVETLDGYLNQLTNGAAELSGKLGELSAGAADLSGSLSQISAGTDDYANKVAQMCGGILTVQSSIAQVNAGLGKVDSNSATINAGAKQVFNSLLTSATSQLTAAGIAVPALTVENYSATLNGVIAQLKAAGTPEMTAAAASVQGVLDQLDSYNQFYTGLLEYTAGVGSVYAGTTALSEGYDAKLAANAGALSDGAKTISGYVSSASEGATKISGYTAAISDGANTLSSSAKQIYDGLLPLKNGSKTLQTSMHTFFNAMLTMQGKMPALTDGINELYNGSMLLSTSMKKFNDEGIGAITNALSGNLETTLDRMRATIDLSKKYQSFGGISSDMTGSVKFIYKTDGIE